MPEPVRERDLRAEIEGALTGVLDPELGLNVVELGLVVGIEVTDREIRVQLTMTTPACPLGEEILRDARERVEALAGGRAVSVELVWDPPWTPGRMQPSARAQLGWGSEPPAQVLVPLHLSDPTRPS